MKANDKGVNAQQSQHWANQYLSVPYLDGGRDFSGMDCWGLVRHVLHYQYGWPLLKSFGHVCADDKAHLTESYHTQVGLFSRCQPKTQAVAAGFRGLLLIHIGICIEIDGKCLVLETSKKRGVTLTDLSQFNRMYSRTEFYHYGRAA